MSLLEARNIAKSFGSLSVLRDISLSVEAGELHAVIGPNGAGKTTFFNLISGLLPPSAGSVWFDGRDVTGLPPHRRVALGMARTFQVTEIFPELSVLENVRVGAEVAAGHALRAWLGRTAAAEVRRRVDEILTLTGLTAKADRLVGELSHGDQRAAEIAMALTLRPRLLLLDEPTAGMGDQETYEVTRLVGQLHRTGSFAIILIEHDMRVVFHLAERVMVLDQGRVLAAGTPEEIAANEAVQAAYLGKVE